MPSGPEHIHMTTVEPRYNEPLYIYKSYVTTNDFLYSSDSKIYEIEPQYNKASL